MLSKEKQQLFPYCSSRYKKRLVPLDKNLEPQWLPYCSPTSPPSHCVLGLPPFPLSKHEALLTALQNGHGSQIEDIYWPEECSDFVPCWCCLEICFAPYIVGRGDAMSLKGLLGLYGMCFRISPMSERRPRTR